MTEIQWTNETWNPIVGCTIDTKGCKNCYAMRMAWRLSNMKATPQYHGTVKKVNGKPVWTGKVAMASDKTLTEPLRRKKPTMYFVNSMGDLFHEDVPDEWIDRVFAVMALRPQHTFQILTKRAARMQEYISKKSTPYSVLPTEVIAKSSADAPNHWPLPNVWLGVSVEDQTTADLRIPHLLNTPAAIRFVSAEPLLEAVDLHHIKESTGFTFNALSKKIGISYRGKGLDWIICGGESGPNARPMHPDWARSLRDQCVAAGVPFFFKQWGEWWAASQADFLGDEVDGCKFGCLNDAGQWVNKPSWEFANAGREAMFRVGAKAAGNLLDGREWGQMPEVTG